MCRAHPRTGGEEGPGGGQRQESWCAERLPGRPEAAGHGGRRGVPSTWPSARSHGSCSTPGPFQGPGTGGGGEQRGHPAPAAGGHGGGGSPDTARAGLASVPRRHEPRPGARPGRPRLAGPCRAGGWGTNTRQEGGREGREGRRASDRTEHGLGTPQPKDGATGTGDKQDRAWTGVTEAAGNEAGVPRRRSAVRVTRCQKLRAPAVTAKGVSRHCGVSPGQLLPGEGTSTSEVREADTPRAGSHRELPGGGRGV